MPVLPKSLCRTIRVLSVRGCVWCAHIFLIVQDRLGVHTVGKIKAREVDPPELCELPESPRLQVPPGLPSSTVAIRNKNIGVYDMMRP